MICEIIHEDIAITVLKFPFIIRKTSYKCSLFLPKHSEALLYIDKNNIVLKKPDNAHPEISTIGGRMPLEALQKLSQQ